MFFSLRSVNQDVVIRLKWGETEYKGKLVSIDSYMNVQLSGAEEYIDQKMTGALGQVLIRYATIRSTTHEPPCSLSPPTITAD